MADVQMVFIVIDEAPNNGRGGDDCLAQRLAGRLLGPADSRYAPIIQ